MDFQIIDDIKCVLIYVIVGDTFNYWINFKIPSYRSSSFHANSVSNDLSGFSSFPGFLSPFFLEEDNVSVKEPDDEVVILLVNSGHGFRHVSRHSSTLLCPSVVQWAFTRVSSSFHNMRYCSSLTTSKKKVLHSENKNKPSMTTTILHTF